MKNAILIVTILGAMASAMAQGTRFGRFGNDGLLRGRGGSRPQLLEPLLAFPEAVEKANSGNPQGYYALAIHYAKGEVIERNAETARQFLQKANDLNYSNAVFVATMLLERRFPETHNIYDQRVPLSEYTGVHQLTVAYGMSLTNATDVAKIRAGYERAIRLGVSIATNELARFERRVEAAQESATKRARADEAKVINAELAKNLVSEMPEKGETRVALRRRLNDPDADDDEGQTFIWTVGGKEGITLDVFIRARKESGWHYLEKATITIDKDGRIIKIEGKPGRTEIQS